MLETELKISRVGFPPFSARGCLQILAPIASDELRRTINGQLVDLSRKTHHKFKSSITCEDKSVFAFEQLWVGAEVEVSCVHRLWQEIVVSDANVQLIRPATPHTIFVQDLGQRPLAFNVVSATTLIINAEKGTKAFINYCPVLMMRVTYFSFATQEWDNQCKWLLELEEV